MRFINLHTHKRSDRDLIEVLNVYPDEMLNDLDFFSTGIHPWRIDENKIDEQLEMIVNRLNLQTCIAVGECGLDKRIETPLVLQEYVFEKQLRIAQKYKRPVIIHCVAAFSEVIEMKKRVNFNLPMIIHGFSKSKELAEQLLDHGFYLSFGKYLLRNPELESVFKMVPDDRFFLETDTTEDEIQDVYELAANYRNIQTKELQEIIGRNFSTVFNRNNKLKL